MSHVEGKDNVVGDSLSRCPYDVTRTAADDVIDQFPDLNCMSIFNDTIDLMEAIDHPELPPSHTPTTGHKIVSFCLPICKEPQEDK